MPSPFVNRRRVVVAYVVAALLVTSSAAFADFEDDLARIDAALKKNPSRVLRQALESCAGRRAFAINLYDREYPVRAKRQLKVCFDLLQIPETVPTPRVTAPSQEELQEKARFEIEQALPLTPDVAHGLEVYRQCAACHMPEGWSLPHGGMPQIAGQHRSVIIKQLADIRVGNRNNALMAPYAAAESIGGAQAIADVAGYIESLEINVGLGKGSGNGLELGERLYREGCARCHGETGEGRIEDFTPRIHAQNYNYLVRQFKWMRDGDRRNAHAEMLAQIQGFGDREIHAVLDYVSRLEPPAEIQAPPDWKNPDFVD
ncbi:MAG: c-type cytochrome [Deltaproteobacteria bacterium]|nr:c-type cytochrome [Deltaproteobacteria bacterium]MBW2401548.1 c-type cytochrome [Deltaproteobacteria bacterium]MBW2666082.1 c-type cytochrome [Deltaproteobacteria bacterium]